ncbi:MAG: hypothetical protein ACYDEV_06115 [Acidiferrobacter sp.]
MSHLIVFRVGYRALVLGLVLAGGLAGKVIAATLPGAATLPKLPGIAMLPIFAEPRHPLIDILNPHSYRPRAALSENHNPFAGISQALVVKPDLGACQSFANGCHEGAIVTMPNHNVMQTLGAGLGLRVGGVRFEYAHGLYTGANFIGIRSQIP